MSETYDDLMRRLLEHSLLCLAAAPREEPATASRSYSEAHLAGSVAYVLSALNAADPAMAAGVAQAMTDWAGDGEPFGEWVAASAMGRGIDVESLMAGPADLMPTPTA